MRKIKWKILLFLILAIGLTASVSILGLNQSISKNQNQSQNEKRDSATKSEQVQKMNVALVNEDQGAKLSGKDYLFGNDIQTSILKDTTHDWSTVSRGVAESGLKRDVYNLMIVIPSDFSKKALSLTSNSPEKIQIYYKINDTGNNDLKAEAEKTASDLLSDMNQRVIDVYFASILTNLQESQDNIKNLVNKEKKNNDRYNVAVHDPLASYTDQFKTVQDYTGSSKDSFTGFQDLLKGHEKSLLEADQENKVYGTDLARLLKMQQDHTPFGATFEDNLQKYTASLSADNVQSQLGALQQANALLYRELTTTENTASLMTQTQQLQNYIADVNSRIMAVDQSLNDTINAEIQDAVRQDLIRILSGESGGSDEKFTMATLDPDINKRFTKTIEDSIRNLQYFTEDDAAMLGIDTEAYKKIKKLAKQYMNEHPEKFSDAEKAQNPSENVIKGQIVDAQNKKAQELKGTGMAIESNPLDLPETDPDTETEIRLNLDSKFDLENLVLSKDGQNVEFQFVKQDGGQTIIKFSQANGEAGTYTISATAKLKDGIAADQVPIFGSLKINAAAVQKVKKEVVEGTSVTPDPGTGDGTTGGGEEGTGGTGSGSEGGQPTVETKEETFIQEVYSFEFEDLPFYSKDDFSLTDMFKELRLIVRNYERTGLLFQLYYGLNPWNSAYTPSGSLDSQATANSYYAIFNRDDLLEAFATKASGNLTKAYKEKLAAFESRIADYKQVMGDADSRSQDVATRLIATNQEAISQNENLARMLQDIDTWREKSSQLVSENQVVLGNSSDEMAAAMALDSSFGSLLATSQNLADSTGHNLDSAKGVYDTFDAIDQEAKNIQKSGEDLISEAGGLSGSLAKKLQADQTFSKNFSKVMKNSRIGDRQNENLYNFLSSPVEKVNGKAIVAADKTTPYYMVLICTIIALFSGYVISVFEKRRIQKDQFREELSLASRNLPITSVTVGIAVIEGLLIGLISGKVFDVSEIGYFFWIGICLLLMLLLVSGCTYLLRQLQMGGMFIILLVLSMYLFLTDAIGLNVDKSSMFGTIQKFSPLQYLETLLSRILNGESNILILTYVCIGIAILLIVCNLFVVKKEMAEAKGEGAHES
ncbi:type VII secretion protein EsaA [Listeria valentina]|uniref:type VII secretion protein EsaA n=1 Tax=Listeria valentina TaxID=2705293 RepID=UPI0014304DF2|nr:type VII secretion protein EsaA [Listeria valentina]